MSLSIPKKKHSERKKKSKWRKRETSSDRRPPSLCCLSLNRLRLLMGQSVRRCWSLVDIPMLSENQSNSECETWLPDTCLHSVTSGHASVQRHTIEVHVDHGAKVEQLLTQSYTLLPDRLHHSGPFPPSPLLAPHRLGLIWVDVVRHVLLTISEMLLESFKQQWNILGFWDFLEYQHSFNGAAGPVLELQELLTITHSLNSTYLLH